MPNKKIRSQYINIYMQELQTALEILHVPKINIVALIG
jgi:hypothetical protein